MCLILCHKQKQSWQWAIVSDLKTIICNFVCWAFFLFSTTYSSLYGNFNTWASFSKSHLLTMPEGDGILLRMQINQKARLPEVIFFRSFSLCVYIYTYMFLKAHFKPYYTGYDATTVSPPSFVHHWTERSL